MSHFVPPLRAYVGTFIALMILTVLTVVVSRFDFGAFNLFIALLIAFVKAGLVAMFFMGLRWEKGVSALALVGSAFFLLLFFALTFADVAYRDLRDIKEVEIHSIQSPVKIISESHSDTSHH